MLKPQGEFFGVVRMESGYCLGVTRNVKPGSLEGGGGQLGKIWTLETETRIHIIYSPI